MPRHLAINQTTFPGMSELESSLDLLANSGSEERGAIFTKPVIVDFILDLSGYAPRGRLFEQRLLEPSFGHGSFLLPAIDRLLKSWMKWGTNNPDELSDAILAVELHKSSFEHTRDAVIERLRESEISIKSAKRLADRWLIQSDFLLERISRPFDFVVGNPPYVRIERVPPALMKEYRARYSTMFDRADIYIPFIERSLNLLADGGRLCFICADRWTKNRYGGPLRNKISKEFHVEGYVDMNGIDAFESEVIAYPAIVLIRKSPPGPTKFVPNPKVDEPSLKKLSLHFNQNEKVDSKVTFLIDALPDASAPWIISTCTGSRLLRHLEVNFPTMENVGCKVGIGVATGADRVFIAPFDELDVELDRKLPLVTTKDITEGKVLWKGLGVVNPFLESGKLVNLDEFPKLKKYFQRHEKQLVSRHVAKKLPSNWYRTIDRINPSLTFKSKLLIPDIKGVANIVVEDGKLYPHHNLYYVTSSQWDIGALQLVLRTGVAHLFVSHYSTKMRGGYLRFQAQHLRRICLPPWNSLDANLQENLISVANSFSIADAMDVISQLYDLTASQRSSLASHAKESIV